MNCLSLKKTDCLSLGEYISSLSSMLHAVYEFIFPLQDLVGEAVR